MVLTVVMDLGGVYFTDGTHIAIEKICERYGIDKEKATFALDGELGSTYRTGAISRDDFWAKARKHMETDIPAEVLESMWNSCYAEDKRTSELVDRLTAAGYELIFLSDNFKSRVEYLQNKYDFEKKFKSGVFSHESGIRKPQKEIYELVMTKTDSRPQDCVFVDNKRQNLTPAKELGMNAILFMDADQLERDLKALGMDF